MYLEGSTGKKFANEVTQYATLIPTIYNADTSRYKTRFDRKTN